MAKTEWITGHIGVNVKGIPMEFDITVPATPVKPHRMLPIFQQMANAFVDTSVNAVEAEGMKISCKAGCGACCRQPVPISETEVYQIAELVESIPEPRRSEIKKKFAEGIEHFQKKDWFSRMNALNDAGPSKEMDVAVREGIDLVMEYFYEGIPCPFLENESCSIHQNRPIACREYLVTTPAENCSKPTAETVRIIDLLIKPSKTVRNLGKTGRISKIGELVLIRALEFAENHPENFAEKTGKEWVADFFRELTHDEIPEE